MDTIVEEFVSGQSLLLFVISYAVGTIPNNQLLNQLFQRFVSYSSSMDGLILSLVTFLMDVLKGYIVGSIALSLDSSMDVAALCGLMAVVGSCFPIWPWVVKAKGGATSLGALLLLDWHLALYTLLGFAVGFLLMKRFAGASLLGVLCGSISCVYLLDSVSQKMIMLIMFVVIVSQHEDSFFRLIFRREK